MSADVRNRDDTRSNGPAAMMICHGRMLFIQGRFNVRRVFNYAFVITKDEGWFSLEHGNSETSKRKPEVFDRFQTCLQGNELCGKCTRLNRLLPLAIPNDRRSI